MFDSQSEKIERAKNGLTKREALLKGELQSEAVRKFTGIESRGEYPTLSEFPDSVFLPKEIVRR